MELWVISEAIIPTANFQRMKRISIRSRRASTVRFLVVAPKNVVEQQQDNINK